MPQVGNSTVLVAITVLIVLPQGLPGTSYVILQDANHQLTTELGGDFMYAGTTVMRKIGLLHGPDQVLVSVAVDDKGEWHMYGKRCERPQSHKRARDGKRPAMKYCII